MLVILGPMVAIFYCRQCGVPVSAAFQAVSECHRHRKAGIVLVDVVNRVL